MASKSQKLTVLDEREESRVPFLRGILTRSLQAAGLPFDDAYKLASKVRDELGRKSELTTAQVRRHVAQKLRDEGYHAAEKQYVRPSDERVLVQVRHRDDHLVPFSKGILGQSLEICALPQDETYRIAAAVEDRLLSEKKQTIASFDLGRMVYQTLQKSTTPEAAAAYCRWVAFTHAGRPLVLLMGGTTGCGKSTVGSLLANRLNIVRTQSTDMLREVMRLMVPAKLLPPLHESSFTAHRALPRRSAESGSNIEPHMVDGFLMQAQEVGIGIEGVFRRAIKEQVSLILEGVHVHPSLQRRLKRNRSAIVVPFVLAVLKKKTLRRQLVGRGMQVPSRRAERYLDHFDLIWQLQSFLLSEADRHHIPIIPNTAVEETIRPIMELISARLESEFEDDPGKVFAP